jgi:hypothetical protein
VKIIALGVKGQVFKGLSRAALTREPDAFSNSRAFSAEESNKIITIATLT